MSLARKSAISRLAVSRALPRCLSRLPGASVHHHGGREIQRAPRPNRDTAGCLVIAGQPGAHGDRAGHHIIDPVVARGVRRCGQPLAVHGYDHTRQRPARAGLPYRAADGGRQLAGHGQQLQVAQVGGLPWHQGEVDLHVVVAGLTGLQLVPARLQAFQHDAALCINVEIALAPVLHRVHATGPLDTPLAHDDPSTRPACRRGVNCNPPSLTAAGPSPRGSAFRIGDSGTIRAL